jgi:hypothetical protein
MKGGNTSLLKKIKDSLFPVEGWYSFPLSSAVIRWDSAVLGVSKHERGALRVQKFEDPSHAPHGPPLSLQGDAQVLLHVAHDVHDHLHLYHGDHAPLNRCPFLVLHRRWVSWPGRPPHANLRRNATLAVPDPRGLPPGGIDQSGR